MEFIRERRDKMNRPIYQITISEEEKQLLINACVSHPQGEALGKRLKRMVEEKTTSSDGWNNLDIQEVTDLNAAVNKLIEDNGATVERVTMREKLLQYHNQMNPS